MLTFDSNSEWYDVKDIIISSFAIWFFILNNQSFINGITSIFSTLLILS